MYVKETANGREFLITTANDVEDYVDRFGFDALNEVSKEPGAVDPSLGLEVITGVLGYRVRETDCE